MNYKARGDAFLVENLEEEEKEVPDAHGIILPPANKKSAFMRVKVIAVGPLITDSKPGDIALAERMFEPLDQSNKKIGVIRSEYVHLIEEKK